MSFFTPEAKTKIVEAVKSVESKSSAEIVVALRERSDDYREVDLFVAALATLATLAALIYHPAELDENVMPLEALAAFVIVSLVVNKVGPLKQKLTPKKRKTDRTRIAARAHFVDAGISRTRDRSGILVFVSELERQVHIVPDIGIDPEKVEGWRGVVEKLEAAVVGLDLGAFATALDSLGPLLEKPYPRRPDDTNELPDEPMTS